MARGQREAETRASAGECGVRSAEYDAPTDDKKFLYDFQKLLAETDAADQTEMLYTATTEEYGDLVSQYDESAAASGFYQYDAQGSADALLDDAESVTDRLAYRAFGAVESHTPSAGDVPQCYVGRQGYYRDLELDLYFVRARYYDPATGQWVSRDPKGLDAGDENLYRYVKNNPVGATDPSGEIDWERYYYLKGRGSVQVSRERAPNVSAREFNAGVAVMTAAVDAPFDLIINRPGEYAKQVGEAATGIFWDAPVELVSGLIEVGVGATTAVLTDPIGAARTVVETSIGVFVALTVDIDKTLAAAPEVAKKLGLSLVEPIVEGRNIREQGKAAGNILMMFLPVPKAGTLAKGVGAVAKRLPGGTQVIQATERIAAAGKDVLAGTARVVIVGGKRVVDLGKALGSKLATHETVIAAVETAQKAAARSEAAARATVQKARELVQEANKAISGVVDRAKQMHALRAKVRDFEKKASRAGAALRTTTDEIALAIKRAADLRTAAERTRSAIETLRARHIHGDWADSETLGETLAKEFGEAVRDIRREFPGVLDDISDELRSKAYMGGEVAAKDVWQHVYGFKAQVEAKVRKASETVEKLGESGAAGERVVQAAEKELVEAKKALKDLETGADTGVPRLGSGPETAAGVESVQGMASGERSRWFRLLENATAPFRSQNVDFLMQQIEKKVRKDKHGVRVIRNSSLANQRGSSFYEPNLHEIHFRAKPTRAEVFCFSSNRSFPVLELA